MKNTDDAPEPPGGGREELRLADGSVYRLHSVERDDDPAIAGAQELLADEFAPHELPGPGAVYAALRGNREPDPVDWYFFEVLSGPGGGILGLLKGLYLPLQTQDGRAAGEGIAMTGFFMLDRTVRGKPGLAGALFESFLRKVRRKAEARGERLTLIAGEAVPAVESFFNRLGVARCYLRNTAGVLEEFRYYQPPLSWDPDTGAPVSGMAAEHLMIGPADGPGPVTAGQVMAAVRSLHYYVYAKFWPRGAFSGEAAFLASRARVQQLQSGMERQLAGAAGAPVLLTKAGRRRLERSGLVFTGHAAADVRTAC